MITIPAVPTLLAQHGNDRDGRDRARDEITTLVIDAARRLAREAGRSRQCATGHHHRPGEVWPCRDDGRRCLCECHDPEGA
jgi:hypothetical protein